eukprot:gene990-585_t
MRQRGQKLLKSSIDDKIEALRTEARLGYGKEEVRRSYIKAELRAKREAAERAAQAERERIKQECIDDWKARTAPAPQDEGNDACGGGGGLSMLDAAWMLPLHTEVGAGPMAVGPQDDSLGSILAAVREFQTATLPLLDTAADDFHEDYQRDVEQRRVLERDGVTGLPTLLALHEPEEAGVEEEEVLVPGDGSAAIFTSTTPPVAGAFDLYLTPRASSLTLATGWRHRPGGASPSLRATSSSPTPEEFNLSSHIPGRSRGPAAAGRPPPPPGHRTVNSRLVVAVNEAERIVKSLRRRGGPHRRAGSAGIHSRRSSNRDASPSVASLPALRRASVVSRPSTAHPVARVVRPLLLLVCQACHRCMECDAAEVVRPAEGADPGAVEVDAQCPSCGAAVQPPAEVLAHYAALLYPAVRTAGHEAAGRPSSSPLPPPSNPGGGRGLLYSCGEDMDFSAEPDGGGVGAESAPAKKPAATAATSCGVGPDENDGGSATIVASVSCGVGVGSEEPEGDKGPLPFPMALPAAVRGLYFNYLWDLWEVEQQQQQLEESTLNSRRQGTRRKGTLLLPLFLSLAVCLVDSIKVRRRTRSILCETRCHPPAAQRCMATLRCDNDFFASTAASTAASSLLCASSDSNLWLKRLPALLYLFLSLLFTATREETAVPFLTLTLVSIQRHVYTTPSYIAVRHRPLALVLRHVRHYPLNRGIMEVVGYALRQAVWMGTESFRLITAMGLGIQWIIMTTRCFAFAMLDLVYFIPHVVWYVLSPRIIRRVSYRCSKRTKRKNMAKFVSMMKMVDPTTIGQPPAGPRSATSKQRRRRPSLLHLSGETESEQVSPRNPAGANTVVTEISPSPGPGATPLMDDIAGAEELLDRTVKAITHSNLCTNCSFDETLLLLQQSVRRHTDKANQRAAPTSLADQEPEPEPTSPLRTSPGATGELDSTLASALRSSMGGCDCENGSDDDEEDEEDARNLHNRATLDIYLPVPVDSLFHAMEERNKRQLTGSGVPFELRKFPVVISINGGAWIVGCYFWNFLVARVLASRGYVVFCPDYRNFPQTDMEGMTLDVSDAIGWVLRNAGRYNGDLDDVTVVGQSAGAHLTMMSLLSQAHLAGYEAKGGQRSGLPPPSDVAYNVPRYVPRQSIRRYIGLSGIYNVRHLVSHLNRRGLYRRVLHQIAGGKEKLPRYSINSYFDPRRLGETGEVLPDNIFDFLPEKMFFLHGDADKSAPTTESANLAYMMRAAQKDLLVQKLLTDRHSAGTSQTSATPTDLPPPVEFKFVLLPGANHTDSIIEEPLAVGNSHLVEYLNHEREGETKKRPRSVQHTPRPLHAAADPGAPEEVLRLGSMFSPVCGREDSAFGLPADAATSRSTSTGGLSHTADPSLYPCVPVENPDEVLVCPAPHAERPILLRAASLVCPF